MRTIMSCGGCGLIGPASLHLLARWRSASERRTKSGSAHAALGAHAHEDLGDTLVFEVPVREAAPPAPNPISAVAHVTL